MRHAQTIALLEGLRRGPRKLPEATRWYASHRTPTRGRVGVKAKVGRVAPPMLEHFKYYLDCVRGFE